MATMQAENIVANLTGDPTGFEKMIARGVKAGVEMASMWEKSTARVEASTERMTVRVGRSFRQFGQNAIQALAVIGIKSWVDSARHEFEEAESASARLDAVLQQNGRNVAQVGERYRKFAEDMEEITTVGDDATVSMLAQAEAMGLTGAEAEQAAKAAVALSAKMTGSAKNANQFMRQGVMMVQGNLKALQRVIPEMRNARNDAERAAIAQKALANGFAIAKKETETGRGAMLQLINAYGNFMETIGEVASKSLTPLIKKLTEVLRWMQKLSPEVKKAIVAFAGIAAAIFSLDPAFTMIKAFITPQIILLSILAAGVSLWVEKLGGLAVVWEVVKVKALAFWEMLEPYVAWFIGAVRMLANRVIDFAITAWPMLRDAAVEAWNTIRDAALGVWDFVYPLIYQGLAVLTVLWEIFALGAEDAWNRVAGGAGMVSGPIMYVVKLLRDGLVAALLIAEFTMRNFAAIAEYTWATLQFGLVKLTNEVTYFFGTVLPAYFKWFQENWVNLFKDAFNFTTTVLSNLASNIGVFFVKGLNIVTGKVAEWIGWFSNNWRGLWDAASNFVSATFTSLISGIKSFFTGLWSWITSKGTAAWNTIWSGVAKEAKDQLENVKEIAKSGIVPEGELKNLTDGFKSSLTPLPTIADRPISELEGKLAERVVKLGQKLNASFNDFIAKRQAGMAEKWKWPDLAKEGRDLISMVVGKPEDKKNQEKVNKANKLGFKIGDAMGKGAKKGGEKFEATAFGSAEALSRLLAFQDVTSGADASDKSVEQAQMDSAEGIDRIDRAMGTANGHLATIAGKDPVDLQEAGV